MSNQIKEAHNNLKIRENKYKEHGKLRYLGDMIFRAVC